MAARKKASKDKELKAARDGIELARRYIVEYGDDEQLRKDAMGVVNAGYWADVRSCAADYLERANKGEFNSDEELTEDFRQYVDQNYWVIYTYWSRLVPALSENSDAYEDEFGEKPPGPEQAAYAALMADISNHPDMEEAFRIARGDDE